MRLYRKGYTKVFEYIDTYKLLFIHPSGFVFRVKFHRDEHDYISLQMHNNAYLAKTDEDPRLLLILIRPKYLEFGLFGYRYHKLANLKESILDEVEV